MRPAISQKSLSRIRAFSNQRVNFRLPPINSLLNPISAIPIPPKVDVTHGKIDVAKVERTIRSEECPRIGISLFNFVNGDIPLAMNQSMVN